MESTRWRTTSYGLTGTTGSIPWRYPGIFPDPEEDTSPIVQEIANVLDMWSCIEHGFEALDPSDQKAFREDETLIPPVFQGFDGNHEAEYQDVARFMIGRLPYFTKFAGRDMESYRPMVERYRRIMRAYLPVWERMDGTRTFTLSELRTILSGSECSRPAWKPVR
jgi:uncharacterized protein YfbU (UPF0304 family)